MLEKERTVDPASILDSKMSAREDFSEYVAQLQLHMALQARNLVPSLTASGDSRATLLHETQANIEKLVSRQRH